MPGLLQPQKPALFSGQSKATGAPALPSQTAPMPTQGMNTAQRPPMPTQAQRPPLPAQAQTAPMPTQRPPMPAQAMNTARRPAMPTQTRNTGQRPPMPSQAQRAPTQAPGRSANAFGQQTAAAARARPLQATTQRRGSVPPTRLR
jgi:hypothetical protein